VGEQATSLGFSSWRGVGVLPVTQGALSSRENAAV
jgi:hypothetical protein